MNDLQDQFSRNTEAELTRLREEFEDEKTCLREELEDEKTRFKEELEARFDQTFQDLKSKADVFEAKTSDLGVFLDEKKVENNDLKELNEGLI